MKKIYFFLLILPLFCLSQTRYNTKGIFEITIANELPFPVNVCIWCGENNLIGEFRLLNGGIGEKVRTDCASNITYGVVTCDKEFGKADFRGGRMVINKYNKPNSGRMVINKYNKSNIRSSFEKNTSEIKGSKNKLILKEYEDMMVKFDRRNIEIVNEYMVNKGKLSDKKRTLILDEKINKLFKRRDMYSLNFSIRYNASEVSALIALYKLKNINSYYLNLVYNNFSDKIKNTKYGKKLQKKIKSL